MRKNRRTEQKRLLPVNEESYEKIKFHYDLHGNLLERYGHDILLEQNTYDIRDRRLTNADGDGCSYDDRDRLITERVEDKKNDINRLTSIAYDKAGNIISVRQSGRDGQAREIAYDYDLKDRLTHMEELDGPVFALIYDKNDRRKEQKRLLPADGEHYEQIKFRYNMRGKLLERSRNNIRLEQSSYDIRGNRLTFTDGDIVGAEFRYGLQNERLEIYTRNSRGEDQPAQKLSYDARGRITGIEDGCGGHTFYQMDAWGRITRLWPGKISWDVQMIWIFRFSPIRELNYGTEKAASTRPTLFLFWRK